MGEKKRKMKNGRKKEHWKHWKMEKSKIEKWKHWKDGKLETLIFVVFFCKGLDSLKLNL